ncbi:MAG: energy transducer TonB [Bdellovibrio sp. CG10_big_fil_rev_8_21_14_0_10_47_8]|nr:MAG: energy transducer TonB [Bdellovibrio sp. CG10_big_fil_rev_8_21_14_0_10_47_8]
MMRDELGRQNQTLNRYVKISLLLHAAVLLIFTVDAVFFTDEPIQFEQSVRVDLVALPDKISKEMPPAAAEKTPEKKAEEKSSPPPVEKKVKLPNKKTDTEAVNLDKTKNKQKLAMEKLKQMQALEEIQKELDKEAQKKAGANIKFKGNVISPGTALTGIQRLQADTYLEQVHSHMVANWFLPEYLRKRRLRTDVLVKFDQNGQILSKEVVRSSGNPTFDDFVLTAIQKSSPVPAPPAKFMRISEVEGFLFKFSDDNN